LMIFDLFFSLNVPIYYYYYLNTHQNGDAIVKDQYT